MKSLAAGQRASKTCQDCHRADPSVLEHRIAAHLEKMECYACHSAWAPQEYGTFILQGSDAQELFELNFNQGGYAKSSYLKKQDAPPLGLNARGKVSPIRPQFILYFSGIGKDRAIGKENQQLAAEWRAFFPHTVRKGAPMCDACHDNPRRFVCEAPESRIYELRKDGFSLDSFWDRSGQKVVNGEFMPLDRVTKMSEKSPAYKKAYVEKWKSLIDRVETR
ncbi:MAG: hypothetical protein A2X94_02780 [Bdellovibrionales bacterium GWB1_55_8]|nr:MAG: hypothetical protein A2X94_02780 [Bdellovibrionales bacterium GWB1_55_8]